MNRVIVNPQVGPWTSDDISLWKPLNYRGPS